MPSFSGWRTFGVEVPVSEIRTGTNTVTMRTSDETAMSNLNIGLIAAEPVP